MVPSAPKFMGKVCFILPGMLNNVPISICTLTVYVICGVCYTLRICTSYYCAHLSNNTRTRYIAGNVSQ